MTRHEEALPSQQFPEVLTEVTPNDVEDFLRLLPQLTGDPADVDKTTESLRRAVSSTEGAVFVIRDEDGRIQSTATASICRIPTGVKPWVDDVVTDKGSRGKGYGKSIMEATHDWFLGQGVTQSNLTSKPSRGEAGSLYEGMGYAERDTRVYRKDLGRVATTPPEE